MAKWTGTKVEGETINDRGGSLKIGRFPYEITDCGLAVNKNNPTGKEQQVFMELNHDGETCKVYFSIESDNEMRAAIAEKELRAFAQAVDFKGVVKPETLKKFIGKFVIVTGKETTNKNDPTKNYVNIGYVEAFEDGEESEAEEVEETEETEEVEETEPEPAPKAAAPGKKRPW